MNDLTREINPNHVDPIVEMHVRVGLHLAKSAFCDFGTKAEERHLFAIESAIHASSERFMEQFGASPEQKLHAKIIIGHVFRTRYVELCRATPEALEGMVIQ